jgi:nucleoid DNA-binding protein
VILTKKNIIMNKTDLIKAVATETGISRKEATKVFDSIFVHISEELKQGNDVALKDFGTWRVVWQRERVARNPKTGEVIEIPKKEVVKFKPSKNIRNLKWL